MYSVALYTRTFLSLSIDTSIDIYTYTHIYIYIYVYAYRGKRTPFSSSSTTDFVLGGGIFSLVKPHFEHGTHDVDHKTH